MSFSEEQIAEIARIAQRVAREEREAEQPRSTWSRIWGWIGENPVVSLATAVSLVVLVLARLIYGVSLDTVLGEAARDYREAEARNDLIDNHLELGEFFLGSQNLRAARVEFGEVLKLDATNPDAQRGIFIADVFAPIAADEYDVEVMTARLDALLEEDPDDPILTMIVGDLALNEGDLDRALAQYDDALAGDPELPNAHAGKADVFSQQGRPKLAIASLDKALELSRGNAAYLHNRAAEYFKLKEYEKALLDLEGAVQREPNSVITHMDMAEVNRILGRLGPARDHGEKSVSLLADERTAQTEFNTRSWFYATTATEPPAVIDVAEPGAKKYLVHLDLALSLQLANAAKPVQLLPATRFSLLDSEARPIRRIMRDKIEGLARARPAWRPRLDRFVKRLAGEA